MQERSRGSWKSARSFWRRSSEAIVFAVSSSMAEGRGGMVTRMCGRECVNVEVMVRVQGCNQRARRGDPHSADAELLLGCRLGHG